MDNRMFSEDNDLAWSGDHERRGHGRRWLSPPVCDGSIGYTLSCTGASICPGMRGRRCRRAFEDGTVLLGNGAVGAIGPVGPKGYFPLHLVGQDARHLPAPVGLDG